MSWQSHFSFNFAVSGIRGTTLELCQSLIVPASIPLDQLLLGQFEQTKIPKQERRELSMNHRKILWAYEHIPQHNWLQCGRELASLILQHPAHTLTIKTSNAGVGVVLVMMDNLKFPPEKKLHFQLHSAPLAWLEERFAPLSTKHSVEFTKDPTCPWSVCPTLSTRTRRAA